MPINLKYWKKWRKQAEEIIEDKIIEEMFEEKDLEKKKKQEKRAQNINIQFREAADKIKYEYKFTNDDISTTSTTSFSKFDQAMSEMKMIGNNDEVVEIKKCINCRKTYYHDTFDEYCSVTCKYKNTEIKSDKDTEENEEENDDD